MNVNEYEAWPTAKLCSLSINDVRKLSCSDLKMLDTVLQQKKEAIQRDIVGLGVPLTQLIRIKQWVPQLNKIDELLNR